MSVSGMLILLHPVRKIYVLSNQEQAEREAVRRIVNGNCRAFRLRRLIV